jgi:hypothetical protein
MLHSYSRCPVVWSWLVGAALALQLSTVGCNRKAAQPASKPATDAMRLQVFTATLARASDLQIYEGLPHQNFDRDRFLSERATQAHRVMFDYAFYEPPSQVRVDDVRELITILTTSGSYKLWNLEPGVFRQTSCGGFHPDFQIRWKEDANTYDLQLCFGCDEAHFHVQGATLECDLTAESRTRLRELLKPFGLKRPLPH